jgi:uncharacterized membrane protein
MKKKVSFLVSRFFKNASFFVLVGTLLYAYFQLPARVTTHFNEYNVANQFISKADFFYATGVVAVVLYVGVSLLSRMLGAMEPRFLAVNPNSSWLQDRDSRRNLVELYQEWIESLSTLVNAFLIVCLMVLLRSHRSEEASFTDYAWLPLAGGGALLLWALFLPVRLRIRRFKAT